MRVTPTIRGNRYQWQGRARDMREMHNTVGCNPTANDAIGHNTVGRYMISRNTIDGGEVYGGEADGNTEHNDIEEVI